MKEKSGAFLGLKEFKWGLETSSSDRIPHFSLFPPHPVLQLVTSENNTVGATVNTVIAVP